MSKDQDRIWELVEKLDYCMLTTAAAGKMRARPMSSIPTPAEGVIHFMTSREGAIDEELAANSQVLLNYSDGSSKFVSISGVARIVEDRALIKRLWSSGAQAFWPNGPDDPSIIALAVSPIEADLWDGSNSIVAEVKMAFALGSGQAPDLGDRKKVAMG